MSRDLCAVLSLLLAAPLAVAAQSPVKPAGLPAPMPKQELRDLVASAHESAQYKQLGVYFRQQEAVYRAKALDAKAELDRRAQVNAGLMQKYPRPVDSAQYFYTAYLANADQSAVEARRYDQLAGDVP